VEYCGRPEQTDWSAVEAELRQCVAALIEEVVQPGFF